MRPRSQQTISKLGLCQSCFPPLALKFLGSFTSGSFAPTFKRSQLPSGELKVPEAWAAWEMGGGAYFIASAQRPLGGPAEEGVLPARSPVHKAAPGPGSAQRAPCRLTPLPPPATVREKRGYSCFIEENTEVAG